jgi:hypothetical protein
MSMLPFKHVPSYACIPVGLWLVGYISFLRMRADLHARDIPWARKTFWEKNWQPEVLKQHRAEFPQSRLRIIYYATAVLFGISILLGILGIVESRHAG